MEWLNEPEPIPGIEPRCGPDCTEFTFCIVDYTHDVCDSKSCVIYNNSTK